MIGIRSLDHFALTFADIEATCDFYTRVFGMELGDFGVIRRALAVGERKINLLQQEAEFEPKAREPTP